MTHRIIWERILQTENIKCAGALKQESLVTWASLCCTLIYLLISFSPLHSVLPLFKTSSDKGISLHIPSQCPFLPMGDALLSKLVNPSSKYKVQMPLLRYTFILLRVYFLLWLDSS